MVRDRQDAGIGNPHERAALLNLAEARDKGVGGWALAGAPPRCCSEALRSLSPQRGRTPPMTSRDCGGRLQERIQWVGPRVGHSTAEPEAWARSTRSRAQPRYPCAPGTPAGGTTTVPWEKWETEATAGVRLVLGVSSTARDFGEHRSGSRRLSSYSPALPQKSCF